jgi:hypothetical protein
MSWRWDQGRLGYFQLDVIRKVAKVLTAFDGQVIEGSESVDDVLRNPLTVGTGMPFLPDSNPSYKIWRNYGRVLELQFLAVRQDKRLRLTDVCRAMADNSLSDDQYLQFVVKRFEYPSPCFEGYSAVQPTTFPFAAIIKWMVSRTRLGITAATLNELGAYLIGNNVNGTEDLAYYQALRPSTYRPNGYQLRQLRELVIFLSQAPFLSWNRPSLHIDIGGLPTPWEPYLFAYASPEPTTRLMEREEEILNSAKLDGVLLPELPAIEQYPEQVLFLEGHRRRATHFIIERSSNVRQMFLRYASNPALCDMCRMDTVASYPWTKALIEVHHLLPLGSLLRFEPRHTSLSDLVGVCPTCHRATHQFYKNWLTDMGQEDFRSDQEARNVYNEAKSRLVGFEWSTHV